ncbi:MAG TPA: hypothetical protein VMI06_17325, partial [Terriglobia bacterium]|nr:hypothetical protein [Terriglobia bacterium]
LHGAGHERDTSFDVTTSPKPENHVKIESHRDSWKLRVCAFQTLRLCSGIRAKAAEFPKREALGYLLGISNGFRYSNSSPLCLCVLVVILAIFGRHPAVSTSTWGTKPPLPAGQC